MSAAVRLTHPRYEPIQAKPLNHDGRVLIEDGPLSRRKAREYLVAPETLVLGTPPRGGGVRLALSPRDVIVDIVECNDLDGQDLDRRDRPSVGIHDVLAFTSDR